MGQAVRCVKACLNLECLVRLQGGVAEHEEEALVSHEGSIQESQESRVRGESVLHARGGFPRPLEPHEHDHVGLALLKP